MKYFYYIAPEFTEIDDILAVQESLKISPGIDIRDLEQSVEINLRTFDEMSWEFFNDCPYYVLVGAFSPNPDAFNRLYMVLANPQIEKLEHFSGSVRYNERGIKQEYPLLNTLTVEVHYPNFTIAFACQDASKYRILPNGAIELARIVKEVSGYEIDRNALEIPSASISTILLQLTNLLGDQLFRQLEPSANNRCDFDDISPDELKDVITMTYLHVGDKITSMYWNDGGYQDKSILHELTTIFQERPDADWYKGSLNVTFKSYHASEELRKFIDHQTNIIIPVGGWLLSDHLKIPNA